jgi:hypothetical protein
VTRAFEPLRFAVEFDVTGFYQDPFVGCLRLPCSILNSAAKIPFGKIVKLTAMPDIFQTAIGGLKKEVGRLEKIAARFEKSNCIHYSAVVKTIGSIEQTIKMLEAGRAKEAA